MQEAGSQYRTDNRKQTQQETEVSYTISQDLASGKQTQQERDLEAIFNPHQRSEDLPISGLQDYQMQLFLLEQQNKKRLMSARKEQDNQESNAETNGRKRSSSTRKTPPPKRRRPPVQEAENHLSDTASHRSDVATQIIPDAEGVNQDPTQDPSKLPSAGADKVSIKTVPFV